MIVQRLFKFFSVVQSATSVHLQRNVGVTAVAFNKELDLLQEFFVDKIREYKSKGWVSGGPVEIGPEYQQTLERELFKFKQIYGKAKMTVFPNFIFEDPDFEMMGKPQS
uniref:ATP synthase peripheral stalk subunit F6, mitochondrial n=1 Tax=Equus asinus TaxID=9793 RepID=A0A8C4PKT3_EQUAS|nr:ATP synthase-coupling factor 6, mitochondrial-like [Equus asinus]